MIMVFSNDLFGLESQLCKLFNLKCHLNTTLFGLSSHSFA